MTRSETLTEDDLRAVAGELGLTHPEAAEEGTRRARARVDADVSSAGASA